MTIIKKNRLLTEMTEAELINYQLHHTRSDGTM